MTTSYYLGVDGGGSKTAFVILDGAGRTMAEALGPSCYYFASGIELVERVLGDGIAKVTAAAGIVPADLDHAFFGLPAYGEVSADVPLLSTIVRGLLEHDRFACDNDVVGAWAGALGGHDGISVVAGTGSIAYGERLGRAHRAGGWGELFGDEGSAYWVAVQGLNAFGRMSDGRLPRGPLYMLLLEHIGIDRDLELVGVVHERWGGRRAQIAALSKVVVEAATAGDSEAVAILHRAGQELVRLVEACHARLGYEEGERISVSYSGGMFNAPAFRSSFAQALQAAGPGYRLCTPLHSPVVGSALYAMKLHGVPLAAPTPGSASPEGEPRVQHTDPNGRRTGKRAPLEP
ncbi:N-acetylglucosamine kinase-like BadF-type ATPase [Catenulispora sp. GAS73]|uniref:N-acetylglucosamine kinase n=1 Tax=Catenulispora sp. GAS73 TaxID=3156269 RepID=UPI003517F003